MFIYGVIFSVMGISGHIYGPCCMAVDLGEEIHISCVFFGNHGKPNDLHLLKYL